jgi:hypothetical protein
LVEIHHSIITAAAEQLQKPTCVAEAILSSAAWGSGWSDAGDIIIFVSANDFNSRTKKQYESQIPFAWLKSKHLWHEDDSIVSVSGDDFYLKSQPTQWNRFCHLSQLDLDATIESTEFGCYFLSGADYVRCGYDSPLSFLIGIMNERQYYLSYIRYLQSKGSIKQYLKQTINADIAEVSLWQLAKDYLREHYFDQRDWISLLT